MSQMIEYDVADFEDINATKGTYAKFYIVPMKDEAASAAEGRPIFKDVEFIEIMAAGNANNIIRRPAMDMDKQRYRRVYDMFKAGDADQIVGTRLSEVPWISRSQVEELTYRKIRTLENLAEISDTDCNVPGMYDLRKKARAWLQNAASAAPFTQMMAEIDALKSKIAALEAEKEAQAANAKPAKG